MTKYSTALCEKQQTEPGRVRSDLGANCIDQHPEPVEGCGFSDESVQTRIRSAELTTKPSTGSGC